MKIDKLSILSTISEKKQRREFIVQLNKDLTTQIFEESDFDDQTIFKKTKEFIENNTEAIARILYRVDIAENKLHLPLNADEISQLVLERIAQKIIYRTIYFKNKD